MEINGLGGLLAFVLGWLLAKGGKLLDDLVRAKRRLSSREVIECLTRSGGMPSGHTASFTALTTYLGVQYGFLSGLSVLAFCMTIIVIYDALNVRYAVGEQGKLLNAIIREQKYKNKKVKVVEGHTIPQVIVGAILGVAIGFLMGLVF